jgi:pyruvate carboxylase subunit B
MRYHVTLDGRTVVVDLEPDGVRVDGDPVVAELEAAGGRGVHGLRVGTASHRVVARQEGSGRWRLEVDGATALAEVVDERTRVIRELTGAVAGPSGPRPVRAPMPGLVVKIEVAEGDEVVEGQGLVIVEAMKMENELRAEGPARVKRVLVEPGQAVEKDQVLVDLAPLDEDGGGEAAADGGAGS